MAARLVGELYGVWKVEVWKHVAGARLDTNPSG